MKHFVTVSAWRELVLASTPIVETHQCPCFRIHAHDTDEMVGRAVDGALRRLDFPATQGS